jgi:23S rRNA (guanosine2251-2'-O)-methyltransferase
MTEFLYGRNAIRESLRARRRQHHRLLVSSGAQASGTLGEILRIAETLQLPVERVERRELDRRFRTANHQGVALETESYPYTTLEQSLALAAERRETVLLLLLDHLQDPQNVGTLLRTAEIVGVHGVVFPGRRAAEITPAVVNASSGAAEHLPICVVTNLAQSLVELQRQGVWIVGLEDDEQAQEFDQADLNIPLGLVVGAEGSGLQRLVRERADFLIRLPMRGHIGSLNAAVAGSIALYQAWRQRQG